MEYIRVIVWDHLAERCNCFCGDPVLDLCGAYLALRLIRTVEVSIFSDFCSRRLVWCVNDFWHFDLLFSLRRDYSGRSFDSHVTAAICRGVRPASNEFRYPG